MGVQSDPLSDYVEALDRQRKGEPEIDEDLREAALGELQGVGAMIWPVDDGEWTLRADRDEDGPFIQASFAEAQPEPRAETSE